jgi:hypothetical protein
VEATQPERGTGSDAMPYRPSDKWKLPEERLLLRYTNAIRKKHEQYQRHLSNGVIKNNEPYVIAINGSNLQKTLWPDEYPHIIKAVFGLGHQQWQINFDTNETTFIGYDSRPSISKAKNSPVSTDTFITGEQYQNISGLIFSHKNIEKRPDLSGKNFIFIHNPTARNRIERGWLRAGREFWVENNELKFTQW